MRLDSFIAKSLGISRMQAGISISKRKVKVDNLVVTKKDYKIDERINKIYYLDKLIEYKEFIYVMLNKPQGVVSATRDKNQQTIIDLIAINRDMFPIGRLDKDSEGLIILTNNGKSLHKIISPNHIVPKKYYVEVDRDLTDLEMDTMAKGIDIKNGKDELFKTQPAKVERCGQKKYFCTITEGKFHQVKRMFSYFNSNVVYLKRISIGNICLDNKLEIGEYRYLTDEEIAILLK
ncbi:MAG: pseudouridine synthase [Bacilli bacterium]